MKSNTLKNLRQNRSLIFMVLPSIILIIMFNYIPLYGITIAFKDYNFGKGIMGSDWVGLENFKFMLASENLMWRLLRNTIFLWYRVPHLHARVMCVWHTVYLMRRS